MPDRKQRRADCSRDDHRREALPEVRLLASVSSDIHQKGQPLEQQHRAEQASEASESGEIVAACIGKHLLHEGPCEVALDLAEPNLLQPGSRDDESENQRGGVKAS
jgi:hypothetical protein